MLQRDVYYKKTAVAQIRTSKFELEIVDLIQYREIYEAPKI